MSSEWVNWENKPLMDCSDEVKEQLRRAEKLLRLDIDGEWVAVRGRALTKGRTYRCKVKKKRLSEECWGDDLRYTHRAVDLYDGKAYEYMTRVKAIDERASWARDTSVPCPDVWAAEYSREIGSGFDTTDWQNSLEKREDCKCEKALVREVDSVQMRQHGIICKHCKLPLSRHAKPAKKIRPCDIDGWFYRDIETGYTGKIKSHHDHYITCADGEILLRQDFHKGNVVFSKKPETPLDQWQTIAQMEGGDA